MIFHFCFFSVLFHSLILLFSLPSLNFFLFFFYFFFFLHITCFYSRTFPFIASFDIIESLTFRFCLVFRTPCFRPSLHFPLSSLVIKRWHPPARSKPGSTCPETCVLCAAAAPKSTTSSCACLAYCHAATRIGEGDNYNHLILPH